MNWTFANGASDLQFFPTFLVWTLDASSTLFDPSLTAFDYPTDIDLSHWELARVFLFVSQNAADGRSISYNVVGQITGPSSQIPEPSSLGLFLLALTAAGVSFAHIPKDRVLHSNRPLREKNKI